jgi:hypothetical protein
MVGMELVRFVEKTIIKPLSRISQQSGRKQSFDSLYEESSMDFEREKDQFVAVEPEKPPLVRGTIRRVNKLFCCMTSAHYLEIRIHSLNFYNSQRFEHIDRSIPIKDIQRIRSYRKKNLYFISLQLDT